MENKLRKIKLDGDITILKQMLQLYGKSYRNNSKIVSDISDEIKKIKEDIRQLNS